MKEVVLRTYEEKQPYTFELYWMLYDSYAKFGGLSVKTPEELLNKPETFWKLYEFDDMIICAIVYENNPFGQKAIMLGSSGTVTSKRALSSMINKELKNRQLNVFAEVSGVIESYCIKAGYKPVQNVVAEQILIGKQIERHPDGFHYYRAYRGETIRKVLYGNPKIN